MRIYPVELDFNFDKEYRFFNFSILKITYQQYLSRELLGFFYNDGTIIITIFFKEFVLRWGQ